MKWWVDDGAPLVIGGDFLDADKEHAWWNYIVLPQPRIAWVGVMKVQNRYLEGLLIKREH